MLKNLGVFKDFSDDSLKTVFEVGEKNIIEMSLLANKEMVDVLCVPTHHFCNLGCKMCHLTNKGLNKKMKEITTEDFIESLIKSLCKTDSLERRTSKDKLLISFMGVGEPLLNLKLIEEVFNNEGYIKEVLGYKDISYALSTMMPNDNLKKLTEMVNRLNMPLKVHFSLHTPINKERFDLIPSSKVSIEDALAYLINYRNVIQNNSEIIKEYDKFHRTTDPVEIHYTLIEGLNDGEEELSSLCSLLKNYKIPIKFIRFNPINELKRSDSESLWINEINEKIPDLRVKTYSPPGRQIGSSCGEFTKHYYHEEIETEEQLEEFKTWQRVHKISE